MSVYKEKQPKREPEEVSADEIKSAPVNTDVDDLLDEIDSVLEENAEEFVKGYVQKGGE